jgi:hypothetical protein
MTRLRARFAPLCSCSSVPVSASAILATQTADACGMTCCIRRASVVTHLIRIGQGQISDERPRISEAELLLRARKAAPLRAASPICFFGHSSWLAPRKQSSTSSR